MFVGILALVSIHASQTGVTTFDVRALAHTHLSGTAGVLLFLAFTAAFAVKTPVFPFHTWSPDAYREAPAAGSLLLAGVMAKLGTYGIVRFDLALFPAAVVTLAPLLLTLGAIGVIYGAVVAAVERDLKRLVAYSSLAHLGFIVIGAFALTSEALTGAVLQMVNHGLYTAALFILIALLYKRLGTFSVRDMRGLQRRVPVLAGVFTLVMLASIGVPGLNGFVGEFLILAGTFLTHRWWAVVATVGVVLAAVYLLWAYQQVFHGKPQVEHGGGRRPQLARGPRARPPRHLDRPHRHLPRPAAQPHRALGEPGRHPRRGRRPPAPATDRPVRRRHLPQRGDPAVSAFSLLAAAFATPQVDYVAILPELILIAGALVLLVGGQLVFSKVPVAYYSLGAGTVGAAALVASLVLWHDVQARGPFTAIADSVAVDGFSIAFLVLVSAIVIVAAAIAHDFLVRERIEGPEYHVLALLAAAGAMLMAAANDLILIFVALEIMSLPLYVMAGMDQRRRESGEAAMKYFVLGAFSSAVFVYGIALVYGATGSTNLPQIAGYLSANIITSNGVLLAGLGLLLVGFGFKVSAVPFHMWTPDVYQGAPTPGDGLHDRHRQGGRLRRLAARSSSPPSAPCAPTGSPCLWVDRHPHPAARRRPGPRAARREADARLLLDQPRRLHPRRPGRRNERGHLRAASTTCSSTPSWCWGASRSSPSSGRRGDRDHDLDAYRGLGRRQPALALAFTVLLLGQTGVPFTTGFLAKFYVISAAVRAHSYALAVIAMLSAAVAAAFYLRLVFLMYGVRLPSGTGSDKGSLVSWPMAARRPTTSSLPTRAPERLSLGPVRCRPPRPSAIFVTVAVTVVFGIWPAPIVDFVKAAGFLF